jgi:hypothetical protein
MVIKSISGDFSQMAMWLTEMKLSWSLLQHSLCVLEKEVLLSLVFYTLSDV